MGNSSSSSGRGQHDDTVDFGYLSPQGVYSGPRDWNQAVVTQLIVARRLAPFYRPLEDYDESWDDDRILAARKVPPDPESQVAEQSTRIEATAVVNSSKSNHSKRPNLKEPSKPEATVYRGAEECPICFLYYPPNINHSRCCDQAICTECFVQIKRSEPTTTHLVSEPAACPYCVQENFGVVYNPPPWRAGMGSETSGSIWDSPKGSQHIIDSPPYPTHKRRQKSFGADSPEVVTTDQIRPDWEAKLAAVRAAVTRRANRRIIMRQVGDRLIPVGVTSGRVQPLTPEDAEASGESGSRRSRRRQQPPPNAGFEQYIGLAGQDLEEIMIMEAMRLSLLDHEEQQRKEAEEKRKKAADSSVPQDIPGAGPSSQIPISATITPSPSLSVPVTAPVSSSAPVHRTSGSLSALRPSFLARSRSPSPSPAAVPVLPTSDSHAESSRRVKSAAPLPFSTLTAALSTTNTASALLAGAASASGTGGSPLPQSIGSPVTPDIIPSAESGLSTAAITPILIIPSVSLSNPQPQPQHQDSISSALSTDTQGDDAAAAYEQLASSPESMSASEPLIAHASSEHEQGHGTPTPESRPLPDA